MARNPVDIKVGYDYLRFKFGRGTMGTDRRLIWSGAAAGGFKGILSTAAKVQVASSSADDAVGQGGAVSIVLLGIGADGKRLTEVIDLDGTTPVESNGSFLVIPRAYVYDSEDQSEVTGPNHGAINIYQTGVAANILNQIPAVEGQSYLCYDRIPIDQCAKLVHVRFMPASISTSVFTGTLFIRGNTGRGNAWNGGLSVDVQNTPVSIERHDLPEFLGPGCEIMLLGKVSAGTPNCSANFEMEFEDL